jgi:hypothetical protein
MGKYQIPLAKVVLERKVRNYLSHRGRVRVGVNTISNLSSPPSASPTGRGVFVQALSRWSAIMTFYNFDKFIHRTRSSTKLITYGYEQSMISHTVIPAMTGSISFIILGTPDAWLVPDINLHLTQPFQGEEIKNFLFRHY